MLGSNGLLCYFIDENSFFFFFYNIFGLHPSYLLNYINQNVILNYLVQLHQATVVTGQVSLEKENFKNSNFPGKKFF